MQIFNTPDGTILQGVSDIPEHPGRAEHAREWYLNRVFASGPHKVRRETPGGGIVPIPESLPNDIERDKYFSRADVPDLVSEAMGVMSGLTLKDDPVRELPPQIEELEQTIMADGVSLTEGIRNSIREQSLVGTVGYLGVIDSQGRPKIREYQAEFIKTAIFTVVDEALTLVDLVLYELELYQESGQWKSRVVERRFYRAFEQNGSGSYTFGRVHQAIMRQQAPGNKSGEWEELDVKLMNEIPFVLMNYDGSQQGFSRAPVTAVAEPCRQAYLLSAFIRNVEYLAAAPTPFVSGMSIDELVSKISDSPSYRVDPMALNLRSIITTPSETPTATIELGPNRCYHSQNPNLKAFWMQIDPEALTPLSADYDKLIQQARHAIQAPIQDGGTTATEFIGRAESAVYNLTKMATNTARCWTRLLTMLAQMAKYPTEWVDEDGDKKSLRIVLSTNYKTSIADHQILKALGDLQARSVISRETLYSILTNMGLTRRDIDFQLEAQDIEADEMLASERSDLPVEGAAPGEVRPEAVE